MINIAKKRLPAHMTDILVYIGYCAVSWFFMRGNMAYYGSKQVFPSWLVNDAGAFFLGGLVPFLMYEVIAMFSFGKLAIKTGGGDIRSLRTGLDYTIVAANIFLFAVKFIYIAVPLYAPVIDIIINPVVTIGFVALYLWYAFYQDYVAKFRYQAVVTTVLGTFITIYGLIAVFKLLAAG